MKVNQVDLRRSCTYHGIEYAAQVADALMWRDGMPERYPEARLRIMSHALGFKASWARSPEARLMIIYEIKDPVEGCL